MRAPLTKSEEVEAHRGVKVRRGWDPGSVSMFQHFYFPYFFYFSINGTTHPSKDLTRQSCLLYSISAISHIIAAKTFRRARQRVCHRVLWPSERNIQARRLYALIRFRRTESFAVHSGRVATVASFERCECEVRCRFFEEGEKGHHRLSCRDPFPSLPAMNDDEWSVVRRGERQRKKAEGPRVRDGAMSHHDHMGSSEKRPKKQTAESALQSIQRKVSSIKDALRKTVWWEEVAELIRRGQNGRQAHALMCLGIGSFMNTSNARHQLACALLLKDLLNNPAICSVTDPVMDEDDVQLAVCLGFQVIAAEEYELKATPNRLCTVLFMPHCDFELNEDMLTAAQKFHFEGIIFLANAFSRYVTGPCATTRRRNESLIGHLHLSRTLLEESCPSPKSSTSETAFNDLAVTTLRQQSIHRNA